jgi:hypothetical protein
MHVLRSDLTPGDELQPLHHGMGRYFARSGGKFSHRPQPCQDQGACLRPPASQLPSSFDAPSSCPLLPYELYLGMARLRERRRCIGHAFDGPRPASALTISWGHWQFAEFARNPYDPPTFRFRGHSRKRTLSSQCSASNDWNIEDMFEYLMLRQVAGSFAGIRAALVCSVQ